jgi:hypothetical protein
VIVQVPARSLHAVISKELGAEQQKLQQQVTAVGATRHTPQSQGLCGPHVLSPLRQAQHWQAQAASLQKQLDALADVQEQLQELKAMKLQEEQTRLRDMAQDADAVCEGGSAAETAMMLKSQQQVAPSPNPQTSNIFP